MSAIAPAPPVHILPLPRQSASPVSSSVPRSASHSTPPTAPAILLFRGRGLVSTLIRWQSRGPYSHAAILMPDGRIVESWQGAGVRAKRLSDWTGIDSYTIPGMSPRQWDTAIRFALSQVGQRYDYLGVARFLTRRPSQTDDKWFCSELVYRSLQIAGVHLFHRIEPWAVSPAMLAYSPLIVPAGSSSDDDSQPCPMCDATGRLDYGPPCPECLGAGII